VNIVKATRLYERWVKRLAPLSPEETTLKHDEMAKAPFPFLRATYYRWTQVWESAAGDLARAPEVLAVGDLHVANFGTWRDAEGRLVWGINDFDEASDLPFTSDLARLGVSAMLAVRDRGPMMRPKNAADAILAGYTDGLRTGGRPFVLEERHPALRAFAQSRLKDAVGFWGKLSKLVPIRGEPPKVARRLLARLLPEGVAAVRVVHRVAGLGSLGRRRFTAIGELSGGFVAREVKELVPPATVWSHGRRSERIHYETIVARAVRCRDPFLSYDNGWIGRRLSPSNSRIEIAELQGKLDLEEVLTRMGFETANVHLGSAKRRALTGAVEKLEGSTFTAALRRLERAVLRDWEDWKKRPR